MSTIDSLSYQADAWVVRFQRDLLLELRSVRGARPGTKRGDAVLAAATRVAEALIGKIVNDLADPTSALSRAIAEFHDPTILGHVAASSTAVVKEAGIRRSRKMLLTALAGLAAFSGGLAVGAAEGSGQAITQHLLGDSRDTTVPLRDITRACRVLESRIADFGTRADQDDLAGSDTLLSQIEVGERQEIPSDGRFADLTPREREVSLLAAQGHTSRVIAERLNVSVRTVDNQLGRVYRKLGVTNRAELTELVGGR